MLGKLFKRKAEHPPPSVHDLDTLRPKVGEVRKTAFEETLYLAPLPVYTGQLPVSIHDFSEVNDVYLQVGGDNRGMVWQAKLLAWVIWIAIIILVGIPVWIATFVYFFGVESPSNTFSRILILGLQVVWTYYLPGVCLMVGIFVHTIISQTREQARQYPLRFNRQRREVCYVSSDTHEVLIVPWEKVTAWVSQGEMVSQYGSTVFFTFGLALENEETEMVQPLLLGKPSQAHAIGTWEAIRQYMEHGVPEDEYDVWQRLSHGRAYTEYELRPYEGLHTWEVEKLLKEEEGGLHCSFSDERRAEIGFSPRTRWPLRRWYIWRVLSFWKMPYMIAEWGHKAGTPYIPEKVREWSAPIPPDQWAKSSAELQRATKIVEQAMNRKKNKLDFRSACQLIGGR
ncbi:DUF6708 domain-containing protein [Pseudomonas quasicaspiana]|uniref:DUF6708 domain-containing protein n=1 Tax=Pseudomonas quasicaspiana TaxID=2829821 RepID=UPI001E60D031|nr:DUF6708 domain-containing protein [Pseudomonas quasicaspiana]MCD5977917.1 hypothetical protein [Pseudomonas quasicaspiana]MCD5990736.1 hypothetical protein [Pseudomonas quasicaspiana]